MPSSMGRGGLELPNGSGMTIIIAEDDPNDRDMIQGALRECRIEKPVVFLRDGEELLEYLQRSGPYADLAGVPLRGLVLLDLNMPRKDGREALADIKGDPALRHLPVVVLSTSHSPDDIAMCYAVGANSFVGKPETYEDMLALWQSIDRYWLQTVACP